MKTIRNVLVLLVGLILFSVPLSAQMTNYVIDANLVVAGSSTISNDLSVIGSVYASGFLDASGYGIGAGTNSVGLSNCIFVGQYAGSNIANASYCAAFGPGASVTSSAQYRFAYGVCTFNGDEVGNYSHVFGHLGTNYVAFTKDGAHFYTPLTLYGGLTFNGGTVDFSGATVAGLSASHISGQLPSSVLPAVGLWNASGMTIHGAAISGDNVAIVMTNGLVATSYQTAFGNYALHFSQNYAETPTASVFVGSQMTYEFWMRRSSTTDPEPLLRFSDAQANGFVIHTMGSSYLRINAHNGSGWGCLDIPTPNYLDGEWHHIAATFDNGVWKIWVNGEYCGSWSAGGTPPAATNGFGFGSGWWGYSYHGELDEMRVSSTVRYTTGFDPSERFETDEDTVALWHFDEGDGTTAADASGNNHTLTRYGNPLPDWVASGLGNPQPSGTVVFTPSGNLGVGTNAPSVKLHVVGDVRIDGNLTVSGVTTLNYIPAQGDLPMGSYTNSP